MKVKIWAEKNIDFECKSRKCFTLACCDVLAVNLLPRKEMWLDQDRSLSMTPQTLCEWTSIVCLTTNRDWNEADNFCLFWRVLTYMHCVSCVFEAIWFSSDQVTSLSIPCSFVDSSEMSEPCDQREGSSANISQRHWTKQGTSLIYSENKSGPRTKPCCTPYFTG